MKTVSLKPALTAIAASVLMSACAMIPDYEKPNVNVPAAFKHDVTFNDGIQAAQVGWSDYFADPRLHRLIDLALKNNTDLRAAALNAEAVRQQYMISRAELLPGINATGNGTRARVAQDLRAPGQAEIASSYNVGLGVTGYELDLFGKVRSINEAALQSYFQSAAARDAAQLSLVASVAKAYFNSLYAQDRMKLAKYVLNTRQKTYELTQLKHRAGVVSAVDLRQQETQIEAARADYEAAVQAKEQAENALALLINQPLPADLPPSLPLNSQFAFKQLPAGLPSDVMLNRPDIRAAEFALKKANANIGAARAAFFPSISLTGMIGTGSTELSGLFGGGNRTWTFAPSINLPIFNWGSNVANLNAAKIRQQIEVVNYEGAVQTAFRDVSNALVAREQLDKRYQATAKKKAASDGYLKLVRLRYKHGIASALDLLDAERSSYGADTELLGLQLTRLENLADVYKALGGGLKRDTVLPASSSEQQVNVIQ